MVLFMNMQTAAQTPGGQTIPSGLRIRFVGDPGQTLACRIERLADGLVFDFDPAVQNFAATPKQPFVPVTEVSPGLYQKNLIPAPQSAFTDGNYSVTLHDTSASNLAIGITEAVMRGGDDGSAIAATPAA